jgi:hypothetical protein
MIKKTVSLSENINHYIPETFGKIGEISRNATFRQALQRSLCFRLFSGHNWETTCSVKRKPRIVFRNRRYFQIQAIMNVTEDRNFYLTRTTQSYRNVRQIKLA